MASRSGATVEGTDGSDFTHRERVVSQYHTSSTDETAADESAADINGDYIGLGGPDTVPLETEGAFVKPPSLGKGYNFLADLFMAPSDDAIKSFQITERRRLIAKTKGSLSFTLYFHMVVALVLLVKLSPAILDYLDIFVLSLEELNIPKPLLWEWLWFAGSFLIFLIGANAIKSSKVGKMQVFMVTVLLLGVAPIGYVLVVNFSDAYAYAFERQSKVYQTWRGLPVSILWYIFSFVALNIHVMELYFAYILCDAWNIKNRKRA